MKQKYLFPLLTMFVSATMCLCLTSCGDDDDTDRAKSSPLTGTWIPSSAIDNGTGSRIEYDFPNYTVTFYEDGQWHTKTYSYADTSNEGSTFPKYYFNGDGTGYIGHFEYNHGKYEENPIEGSIPIKYEWNGDKVTLKIASEYIDFIRKYNEDMTVEDLKYMENYVGVLTYNSVNKTLADESISGGTIYYSKQ